MNSWRYWLIAFGSICLLAGYYLRDRQDNYEPAIEVEMTVQLQAKNNCISLYEAQV